VGIRASSRGTHWGEGEIVSGWEVIGVFVGIPVLVLLVIALPIFGPVWWRALRKRTGSGDRG
jgi:hypothetical protein